MRISEKILLSFLIFGISVLGLFVGWKYYEIANNKGNIELNAAQNVISATSLEEDPLSVRNAPYYSIAIQKNGVGKGNNNNSISDKKIEADDINGNYNSSEDDFNDNYTEQLDSSANENLNTNSGNLVSASFQNNNNFTDPSKNDNDNVKNKNSNTNINSSNVNNSNTNGNIDQNAFSFAVIGDSQRFKPNDAKGGFQKAVGNIANSNVNLVMTVGDLVSSCDENDCAKKLAEWKQAAAPLLEKVRVTMGNHDRTGKDVSDKSWEEAFNMPTNGPEGYSEETYSFNYANSHFVVLNSEKPKEHIIGKDQRDWLETDLANNKKDNIFVFFHEPAYPVSSKIDSSLDANKTDRDILWDILKNNHITAVFSGHEHIMSRKNIGGLYQFVIGNTDSFDHDLPKPGVTEYSYQGQHYAIVTVKGKEITVNVYKIDGSLLNSFVIPR